MGDAIIFMVGVGFGTIVTTILLVVAIISDDIREKNE